jgi:superoxide dismutase, Fe-Mn family
LRRRRVFAHHHREHTMSNSPFSRRQILSLGAASLASTLLPARVWAADAAPAPRFALPALPWDPAALDPVISASTMAQHYGKHHKAYADNLAKLLPGSPLAEATDLADVIRKAAKDDKLKGLYNNAAQTWNHTFFWNSLRPNGGGTPPAELAKRIEADFGSLAALREATLNAATGQFGSGWVWLVLDKPTKKLAVVKTGNADSPLTNPDQVALATVDVWEHAYYLDYQSRRKDYAAAVFDKLINWGFVADNLAKA